MAQSLSVDRYPYDTMTLTGQGTVMATPDLAVIRLGVQTIGHDLPLIQSKNAQISQINCSVRLLQRQSCQAN